MAQVLTGLADLGAVGAALAEQQDELEAGLQNDVKENFEKFDIFSPRDRDGGGDVDDLGVSPLFVALSKRGQLPAMKSDMKQTPTKINTPEEPPFTMLPLSLQYALRHRCMHFGQTYGYHGSEGLHPVPKSGEHYYAALYATTYGATNSNGTDAKPNRSVVVPLHGRPKRIPAGTSESYIAKRHQGAALAAGTNVTNTANLVQFADMYGGFWRRSEDSHGIEA